MDLALGAMGSLLPKLGQLLSEEYKMQTSVKQDIEAFSRELGSMRAALQRVAEVPRDQLDGEVKLWAGDVRELSYDMEDIVDSLLVRVKGSGADSDMDGFKELISKMKSLFKKGKARRQIAMAIKDIKEQVQDVASRHERYKADGVFANLAAATRNTVDPLPVALYEDKQRIVGIENARDELIEKLCLTDASKNPKILSIVGFGGLGKTTLAKAVYDELQSNFDCAAFVSVSRNPDLKKVFKDILFEVDKERYFIVVDDIWDVNAWKIISFALMASKCGSRVITTTRNLNVSKECCSCNDDMVYNMKPLPEGHSQRLFYNRIFPKENICPPQLEQVSADILKKCGGVPLAIITLASHLASNQQIKPKSQWYVLLNSIGSGLTKGDANLEEMRRILSFSYYDLPSHLKTCLLYLSIFPEDRYIGRNRLIRRWIAEGFIQDDNFELGESYFNELVNRSMIQPMNIDVEGKAEGCVVHDLMLDLICDLSSEENLVTILDVINEDTPFKRMVRRLSLQKSMTDVTNTRLATTSISQVRSFTIFSPAINQMLPISRFEVLRVLDLQDCDLGESKHLNLSSVGNLLHLRYLGLRNTDLKEIPVEIGKLLFLQILDLGGLNLDELPANFVCLRNLICLYIGHRTYLPVGFKILMSLQELTGVWLKEDGDDLEALGYLSKLRVLSFRWSSSYSHEKHLILVESLGKLHKLQNLDIVAFDDDDSIDVMRGWMPSPHLRRFETRGWFQMLPAWIRSSSLPLLSYLSICVHEVRSEDIRILGAMQALRYVYMKASGHATTEEGTVERLTLSADAFPRARECCFEHVILVPGTGMFPPGAMPMVRKLRFGLRVLDIIGCDFNLTVTHLPSLQNLVLSTSISMEEEKNLCSGSEKRSCVDPGLILWEASTPSRDSMHLGCCSQALSSSCIVQA
uniref:Uncharacterized protein n=1 Tax=Avena sativa TaxID=4498 RepID=A0ACD5TCJ6_AVESA